MTPRTPLTPWLLLTLWLFASCAPMSVMQGAQLVPKGVDKTGVGGVLTMPLAANTVFDPDNSLSPEARSKQPDLQYLPLPNVVSWIRRGTGWGETQGSVAFPGFVISFATKLGLVGTRPDSPFSLAVSGELNFAMITGTVTAGATLFLSARMNRAWSLELSTRVGNYAGLWLGLGVVPTVGVTVQLPDHVQLHVGLGGNIPTGIGPTAPSAWLYAGATL